MAFQGNLETMPLADLLQWAANGRQTGTISIANASTVKKIFIENGVIISCTSSDPREFLGHFLVSHGAIRESDLAAAVTDQERDSGLLGQILVERGAISDELLRTMLRLKAEEAIFDLFTWAEGRFTFIPDALPSHELEPISLGVTGLLLEGMRRLDESQRITEVIPSSLCVPVAVAELGAAAGADDDEIVRQRVLEAVNDDRTVEEICLHSHSSEFHVCEVLLQEVREGRLKIVRPRTVPVVPPAGGASSTSLLESARRSLSEDDLERSVRFLHAASCLEPHDRGLHDQIAEVEAEVRKRLAGAGIERKSVLELAGDVGAVPALDLSPSEGFIISRIDGRSTIGAIVMISPLAELDAMIVFWKLARMGCVRLV